MINLTIDILHIVCQKTRAVKSDAIFCPCLSVTKPNAGDHLSAQSDAGAVQAGYSPCRHFSFFALKVLQPGGNRSDICSSVGHNNGGINRGIFIFKTMALKGLKWM
jgi:hypothetical protein